MLHQQMEVFLAQETQISSARTFFLALERTKSRKDLQHFYSNRKKITRINVHNKRKNPRMWWL